MPVVTSKLKSGKLLRRIDPTVLMKTLSTYPIQTIVLEHVSARPGQGAVSTFNFGHSFGTAETCARLTGAKIVLVRPAEWKKIMQVTSDKNSTRDRASGLVGSSEHWPLVKHDGRAEAYLLARMALEEGAGGE